MTWWCPDGFDDVVGAADVVASVELVAGPVDDAAGSEAELEDSVEDAGGVKAVVAGSEEAGASADEAAGSVEAAESADADEAAGSVEAAESADVAGSVALAAALSEPVPADAAGEPATAETRTTDTTSAKELSSETARRPTDPLSAPDNRCFDMTTPLASVVADRH